jgi:hypothetical protein
VRSQKIAPLAQARERRILDALTAAERVALGIIMKKPAGAGARSAMRPHANNKQKDQQKQ